MNASDPLSIPARFAAAIRRYGDLCAVRSASGEWTYAGLDERSNRVAAEILRPGGDTSPPVALLFEHDAPLIAAIFGTLKAGRLYVALDASHPPGQIRAMLESS